MISWFHFDLMQYRWYRRWRGGTYIRVIVTYLGIGPFWEEAENFIDVCGSVIIAKETYKEKDK